MHPGMDKTIVLDMRQYVGKSTTCKDAKAPNIGLASQLGKQRVTSHLWQIIAQDFIGPLPRSRNQNQYILSIVDLFSKWIMLIPFRKIDSESLCNALRDQ